MIKAAILDFDGTLLDSMSAWSALDDDFLYSQGKMPREGLHQDVMSLTLRQSAQYFRREYGVALSEEEIMDTINSMVHDAYFYKIPLKPGAKEALELLKSRNIAMVVATATERPLAEAAIKRNGVSDYFKAVFTCGELGKSKTEPDVFLQAAEFLHAKPEETLVLDDAPFAIKTAKSAGFRTAQVYDDVTYVEGTFCGEVLLHDFKELPEFLKGLFKEEDE